MYLKLSAASEKLYPDGLHKFWEYLSSMEPSLGGGEVDRALWGEVLLTGS